MVIEIKGDRRGLASLFDAFMFLMAVTALCAFLSLAETSEVGEEGPKWEGQVERAHVVLVSSSMQLRKEGSEPGQDEIWVRITSLAIASQGEAGPRLPAWARAEVETMLHQLLGPGWGFSWSLRDEGAGLLLAGEMDVPGDADLFVSNIGVSATGIDGGSYILCAWRE